MDHQFFNNGGKICEERRESFSFDFPFTQFNVFDTFPTQIFDASNHFQTDHSSKISNDTGEDSFDNFSSVLENIIDYNSSDEDFYEVFPKNNYVEPAYVLPKSPPSQSCGEKEFEDDRKKPKRRREKYGKKEGKEVVVFEELSDFSKFEFHLKPLRRKNTFYSKEFPSIICSSPYWYSFVLTYPNDTTISPNFFLKLLYKNGEFLRINHGIVMKKIESKDYKKRSEKKIQKLLLVSKEYQMDVYILQFEKTSNNLKSKFIKFCIEDDKSKIIIHESRPINVISRKGGKEELFWKSYSCNRTESNNTKNIENEEKEYNNKRKRKKIGKRETKEYRKKRKIV